MDDNTFAKEGVFDYMLYPPDRKMRKRLYQGNQIIQEILFFLV